MTAKEKRERFEKELQRDKMQLEIKNIDLELLKIDEKIEGYMTRKKELEAQLKQFNQGETI